ncbi:uncharacterized protein LOC130440518 [Diorhabda sublineata]|uniref:uncharacterized protein LOC130440518 n=1 Tax=Diorhabda sublineata TaxID=1163346 RepID=UPI0024E090F5|nr:uncharacterized protein LOC130440518 [Diorhabda sublineata]
MLRIYAIFLIFCVFSSTTYAAPKFRSDVKACYSEPCPDNTFACEKLSGVSKNRQEIIEEVHCLDLRDNVLKNVTRSKPNHFGSSVMFQSYSYSGTYEIYESSGETTKTLDFNTRKPVTNEVEILNNSIEKNRPKHSRPQYSEVEDLNKVGIY